jgi:hypothetical protein
VSYGAGDQQDISVTWGGFQFYTETFDVIFWGEERDDFDVASIAGASVKMKHPRRFYSRPGFSVSH